MDCALRQNLIRALEITLVNMSFVCLTLGFLVSKRISQIRTAYLLLEKPQNIAKKLTSRDCRSPAIFSTNFLVLMF